MEKTDIIRIKNQIIDIHGDLCDAIYGFFEQTFPDNKLINVKFGDFCSSTPIIEGEKTLDEIDFRVHSVNNTYEIPILTIYASDENDTDSFAVSYLPIEKLVEIIEFLEDNKEEIVEYANLNEQ